MRNVSKAHPTVIAVQRCVFFAEVADEDAHPTSVQIVSKSDPHVRLLYTLFAYGDTGIQSDVLKSSVAEIPIEIVRFAIIRDKQVELAIIIKVGPNYTQAEEAI